MMVNLCFLFHVLRGQGNGDVYAILCIFKCQKRWISARKRSIMMNDAQWKEGSGSRLRQ